MSICVVGGKQWAMDYGPWISPFVAAHQDAGSLDLASVRGKKQRDGVGGESVWCF